MSDNYDTSINYWQCPVCAMMNTVALNTCKCGFVRAARGDEPEQHPEGSRLSDEDAQVLELVRLARQTETPVKLEVQKSWTGKLHTNWRIEFDGKLYPNLQMLIAELRSRLAPKPPQRPTKADADRLIDRLGIYLRGAIDKGDGFAVPLKIDVDDYLKRNKENGGDDGDD